MLMKRTIYRVTAKRRMIESSDSLCECVGTTDRNVLKRSDSTPDGDTTTVLLVDFPLEHYRDKL